MITNKENQAQLFSIFHDGTLSFNTFQHWAVDCQYLAEKLNPTYSSFILELHGIKILSFHPWFQDTTTPSEIWQEPSQIISLELEILGAELVQNEIKIFCQDDFAQEEVVGGELYLEVEGITLFTQEKELFSLAELKDLATDYWTKFAK